MSARTLTDRLRAEATRMQSTEVRPAVRDVLSHAAELMLEAARYCENVSDWIPVTDRLPTHNYGVIAVITDWPTDFATARMLRSIGFDRVTPDHPFVDCASYIESAGGWRYHIGGEDHPVRVTHWRGKPELPAARGFKADA